MLRSCTSISSWPCRQWKTGELLVSLIGQSGTSVADPNASTTLPSPDAFPCSSRMLNLPCNDEAPLRLVVVIDGADQEDHQPHEHLGQAEPPRRNAVALAHLDAVRPVFAQVRSEEQRLNSSHVEISYAVFCLKKKKTHRF